MEKPKDFNVDRTDKWQWHTLIRGVMAESPFSSEKPTLHLNIWNSYIKFDDLKKLHEWLGEVIKYYESPYRHWGYKGKAERDAAVAKHEGKKWDGIRPRIEA